MYWDPTGHWQQGDENLSPEAQEAIIQATNDYYNATDDAGRAAAHQAAENVRNNPASLASSNGGSSSTSGSSSSSSSGSGSSTSNSSSDLFNELTDMVLSQGYFTKDSWTTISSFHPMARKDTNDFSDTGYQMKLYASAIQVEQS